MFNACVILYKQLLPRGPAPTNYMSLNIQISQLLNSETHTIVAVQALCDKEDGAFFIIVTKARACHGSATKKGRSIQRPARSIEHSLGYSGDPRGPSAVEYQTTFFGQHKVWSAGKQKGLLPASGPKERWKEIAKSFPSRSSMSGPEQSKS